MRLIYALFLLLLVTPLTVSASLYNTTNLSNANDIYEQTKALNDIVEGTLSFSILLIAFAIPFSLIFFRTGDVTASIGGSSFFTALTASILLPLDLIAVNYYQITIVIMAAGILFSLWAGARR